LASGIGDKATKPKNEVEALFGYTSFSGADTQAKKAATTPPDLQRGK